MTIGIHQPIFFPWVGYFDKMAKSDIFVLLDEVQLEKGSYMYRNRILDKNGNICYLTISGDKHGYLDKKYNEIISTNKDVWIPKHINQIKLSYEESPYFDEVWNEIKSVYDVNRHTICDYAISSVVSIAKLLNIDTKLLLQSDCEYDLDSQKNDLVLSICKGLHADQYLSGNGAKKYMEEQSFENEGITLKYQRIEPPVYQHLHNDEFVSGLSILDMLFSCGIEKTKKLFWDNCSRENELYV